jgi:hypothetical protein
MDDGNEFEGMTPRDLRNLLRSLQADLRKAVEHRAKLREALKAVYGLAAQGMGATFDDEVANDLFGRIVDETITARMSTEGKR